MPKMKSLVKATLLFPESPRWHDHAIWFTDLLGGAVYRISAQHGLEVVVSHSSWLSGIGWRPDGTMLVVAMEDRKLMSVEDGRLMEYADLSQHSAMHTNDMVVDWRGRAYIGEVGFDIHGGEQPKGANLLRVDTDGSVHVAASELLCPNGMCITESRCTFIVAETLGQRLTAFDLSADGELTNQRIWADLGEHQPDGICLDAEGAIWVACPFQGRLLRVFEGGEIASRWEFEDLPAACMLVGESRQDLVVCRGKHPDEAAKLGFGGVVESVSVEVPGVGLP